jgi:hypothetical protein
LTSQLTDNVHLPMLSGGAFACANRIIFNKTKAITGRWQC